MKKKKYKKVKISTLCPLDIGFGVKAGSNYCVECACNKGFKWNYIICDCIRNAR